jgi:Spy/CpxP family protein refolding chaperone
MESAIQANNIGQIRTLAAKQAGLESQLTQMRAETMAKFYTMLTPEQKTKFQQIHQRMRQRWEQRNTEHPAS